MLVPKLGSYGSCMAPQNSVVSRNLQLKSKSAANEMTCRHLLQRAAFVSHSATMPLSALNFSRQSTCVLLCGIRS